jgi:hypothetical protein
LHKYEREKSGGRMFYVKRSWNSDDSNTVADTDPRSNPSLNLGIRDPDSRFVGSWISYPNVLNCNKLINFLKLEIKFTTRFYSSMKQGIFSSGENLFIAILTIFPTSFHNEI